MLTNRQAAIRERAYALWVESGHPDGRSDEYWLQAEHELETAMERFGAASHERPCRRRRRPGPQGQGRVEGHQDTRSDASQGPDPKGGVRRVTAEPGRAAGSVR